MLAEIFELLLLPLAWMLRRRRAKPEEIKRFYRSAEWKLVRFDQLVRQPGCTYCGRSAKDGAKMNVDHIRPLSRRWDLRVNPRNLQTACASCNWGKGGRTVEAHVPSLRILIALFLLTMFLFIMLVTGLP